MTTQNMHPEDRDVDVSGAEQQHVSDTKSTPASPDQAAPAIHHETDAAPAEEKTISDGEPADSASSKEDAAPGEIGNEHHKHVQSEAPAVETEAHTQSEEPAAEASTVAEPSATINEHTPDKTDSDAATLQTSEVPAELFTGSNAATATTPGSSATPKEEQESEEQAEVEAEGALLETVAIEPAIEQDPMPEADKVDPSYTPTLSEQQEIRPFTAFMEEFRQAEEARGSSLQDVSPDTLSLFMDPETSDLSRFGVSFNPELEQIETSTSSEPAVEQVQERVTPVEPEIKEPLVTDLPAPQSVDEHEREQKKSDVSETEKPAASAERSVSPLLRPATRLRLPRHSNGRHREENSVADVPVVETNMETQTTTPTEEAVSAPTTEQPRPARRYRFDRPSASRQPQSPTPAPAEETKEAVIRPAPTTTGRAENDNGDNGDNGNQRGNGAHVHSNNQAHAVEASSKQVAAPVEPQNNKAAAQPSTPVVEQPTPAPEPERRRRTSSQERQREREKEQAAAEAAANTPEPVAQPEKELSPEELPPLEYSELQAASSRRRRRRRSSSGVAVPAITSASQNKPVLPELPVVQTPAAQTPVSTSPSPVTMPRNLALPGSKNHNQIVPTSVPNPYNIVSGYTVNQMNMGNDNIGPFMGPEPTPARGSTPVHNNTRTVRTEVPRTTANYTNRLGEPTTSSFNQFANTVVQAIQAQTDRMVTELRRANQSPTNISVSLPPFPSNERVGVFVDVANLLYSARTLRMTVDFGKLLDFLRGNRRLVRAQAYCPTSPQPGDEQMFLQAVKGLGYRITTKNYKTFSSGAKKADLDLDLCMDVVRLVDGRAVDCIVLVSGDSDFMPMLDYCSDHGVRVEVAAFDEAMSTTLRQSCDLFVNLSMLEEIRA